MYRILLHPQHRFPLLIHLNPDSLHSSVKLKPSNSLWKSCQNTSHQDFQLPDQARSRQEEERRRNGEESRWMLRKEI